MTPPNFGLYPGWVGLHTRDQAPGAMPNGTRIVKTAMEPGDGHQVGSRGTVLGSIDAGPDGLSRFGAQFFYFVEWDDTPQVAVGVASAKIGRA